MDFGWNKIWEAQFQPYRNQGLAPARVTAVYSQQYEVGTRWGKAAAFLSGKLKYEAYNSARLPVIGDWVAVSRKDKESWVIIDVLPRQTCLQRQRVDGDVEPQAIAANVDTCLIVQALAGDFSLARLDRYVALAETAGVKPVVVLTKADLVAKAHQLALQVELAHPAIAVHVVSAVTGQGVDELKKAIELGKTHVAVGSSGVGKSTLLNLLAGEEIMKTASVREYDSRGRHTTSHRQMFILPDGAFFIDTPGIRELALFEHCGLTGSFRDIEQLARNCKFKDCAHESEPGCAVRQAIENGELAPERLKSYRKMLREAKLYKQKQVLLDKKLAKAKIKRGKAHYKDFVRGG